MKREKMKELIVVRKHGEREGHQKKIGEQVKREKMKEKKEEMGRKRIKGGFFFFVPNMFPSSSQWVPIKFPICSPCVPQGCSQSHIFCPKSSLSHLYR